MVILAMFADQSTNARALEELGVAVSVRSGGASAEERAAYDPGTVSALRAAVERVLQQDGTLRSTASRVAARLGERPTPAATLDLLMAP
jgi:UDP:flavonoid glycosyltransferase YjiC (YdhE family)